VIAARAAAEHHAVDVEQVHDDDGGAAHHGARLGRDLDGRRVPRVDRGGEGVPGPVDRPEVRDVPQVEPPCRRDPHDALGSDRGSDLAAVPVSVRGAGERALLDHDVAGIARVPPGPADGFVVDDEPDAEPGAEVHEGEVPRRGLPRQEHLADGRRGDVLLEEHRVARGLGEGVPQGHVLPPRQERRVEHDAGVDVDRPRAGDADPEDRVHVDVGRAHEVLDRRRHRPHDLLGVVRRGGRRRGGRHDGAGEVEQHVGDDRGVDVHADGEPAAGLEPQDRAGLPAPGHHGAGLDDHAGLDEEPGDVRDGLRAEARASGELDAAQPVRRAADRVEHDRAVEAADRRQVRAAPVFRHAATIPRSPPSPGRMR
jgi:hypothetical protein